MSDEEDYLSDKFLVEATTPSIPKTYSRLRKEALKKSEVKNAQNRTKSRRQLELESRREGLGKSLFERAKEDEAAGISSGNKALSIMMKMGFKPGQSLGSTKETTVATSKDESSDVSQQPRTGDTSDLSKGEISSCHKAEPLPLNEWEGKKGIGLVKRSRSPSSIERVAKMAKMEEEARNQNFRDRARQQYDERRAEGRIVSARRTCITLDEKAGKSFNILWLDPTEPDSFPDGLIDALTLYTPFAFTPSFRDPLGDSLEKHLKRQMQQDGLQPLTEDSVEPTIAAQDYPPDVLEEAAQFLRLQAQDRLQILLGYLREHYCYCFWCGTQYDTREEMAEHCPGPDEDAHD